VRLVSFRRGHDDGPEGFVGVLDDDGRVVEVPNPAGRAWTMREYLQAWPVSQAMAAGAFELRGTTHALTDIELLAPVPRPASVRDFYAFEAHVKRARLKRGMEVPPEWYEMPIFYYSNHGAVIGPEAPVVRPLGCQELDYELEVACVIGRGGRNLTPDAAEASIAGFTILNDWSARDIQRAEMKVGLGPAKGKDFATSLGPWLVTPDELAERAAGLGRYDLAMTVRVNGEQTGGGTLRDLHWRWGEMIARASQNCGVWPGDVIGSGCVGTGCQLEQEPPRWLQAGDVVELEVGGLGVLRNPVVESAGVRRA